MNRETKDFETKGGFKIVANAYITGREMRNIRDCYIGEADVNVNDFKKGNVPLTGIKGGVISKAEDISIEALIVSVNGSKEKVLEAVSNLPSDDYDEVVEYINTITSPKKDGSDTLTP